MTGEIVLALDLGSNTGWACSDGTAGVKTFPVQPGVSDAARHGWLGFRFCGWLGDLLVETGAAVVVIETPPVYNSNQAKGARVLQGLRMLALTTCYGHERAVEEVAASSWRSWAKQHDPDWIKGDLADARAILRWWLAERAATVFGEDDYGVAAQ